MLYPLEGPLSPAETTDVHMWPLPGLETKNFKNATSGFSLKPEVTFLIPYKA